MGETDIQLIVYIVLVVLLFVGTGFIFEWGNYGDIKELGQSICEEVFDMDFDSCDNKELKCKVKEVVYEKQYDGIVIQIE